MKKLSVVLLSVCLIAGFAALAQSESGKNIRDPFVTVIAGGCLTPGDSLIAAWSYEGDEPKFGGDAVFSVAVTVGEEGFPMMLEFGITRDSEEDPPEDYTGQMYYTCNESNICTGNLDNLSIIIGDAVGAVYPDYSEISFDLYRVDVKAMDPSVEVMVGDKKVKRQNYFLENVCEVDDQS